MPSITRRRSDSADRRVTVEAQILATTERLLTEGVSFTELGVQRIATEAGVARSTFYTYFADKTQLLMRLAESMSQTSFGVAGAWQPVSGQDGEDGLADTFLRVIGIYRRNAAVLTAVSEVSTYDPVVRQFWKTQLDRFTQNAEALIIAEQETGRAPTDIDPVAASRLMIIGGHGFLAHHITADDGSGDAAAARELAATWWYGIFRRRAKEDR